MVRRIAYGNLLSTLIDVPHILIDITRLFGTRIVGRLPTGIDRVSLEYLRRYGTEARAILQVGRYCAVLPRALSTLAFDALIDVQYPFMPIATRLLFSATMRSAFAPPVSGCIVFNTGHWGLNHRRGLASLRRRGARPFVFIHDLIPIARAEFCRPGERDRHVLRIRNALKAACGIMVNSHGTLEELEQFAEREALACPPTVVAPLAPAPLVGTGPRPMDAGYFVMLGTIEPRKNHWLLLQVWRRLIDRLGDAAPRLVIIGRRGWQCASVTDMLDRCGALSGIVVERADCGDAELAVYLRHAQALLMPSFAEGYGMPIAEALAAGTPVIASDLKVFREIAGRIPDYADSLDERRWEDLVLEYAEGYGGARSAQLRRLQGYQSPTWRNHFRIVDDFVNRLCADRT